MNETLLRPFTLLAAFLLLLLGGCDGGAGTPPPLQGASMGGPFTLTGPGGQRVSDTDFAGRYRIVYFGFAYCPDVCPVDLQTIGAGLRQFEQKDEARAARVQPIFISVDPARDTPALLARYVSNFHPRLIGLTGSPEEIAKVARAYGVYYQLGEPEPGSEDYPVDHSRIVVLYGPKGEPIAILPHDKGPAALADELDRWVT